MDGEGEHSYDQGMYKHTIMCACVWCVQQLLTEALSSWRSDRNVVFAY